MGFVYHIALILWSLFLLQASSLSLAKTQQQDMVYNVTNFRSDTKLGGGKCNLYQGIWVVDNSYPLYKPLSCPFINPQFDCIKYGRPDKQYLKYSWKPDSCNLPRYLPLSLPLYTPVGFLTKKIPKCMCLQILYTLCMYS